jgi:hypothetical protein
MSEVKFYATYDGEGQAALHMDTAEARYHVWVNESTLRPYEGSSRDTSNPILYKNPPLGIKPHTPGHFNTRYLKIGASKAALAMFAQMEAAARANNLMGQAIAKHLAQRDAAIEAAAEETRLDKIREAGPDLARALATFVGIHDEWADRQIELDDAIDVARAALAKAGVT